MAKAKQTKAAKKAAPADKAAPAACENCGYIPQPDEGAQPGQGGNSQKPACPNCGYPRTPEEPA